MFLARRVPSPHLPTNIHTQGNLNDQKPVTIFDPIHDTVRVALDQRYFLSEWVSSYDTHRMTGERIFFTELYDFQRALGTSMEKVGAFPPRSVLPSYH